MKPTNTKSAETAPGLQADKQGIAAKLAAPYASIAKAIEPPVPASFRLADALVSSFRRWQDVISTPRVPGLDTICDAVKAIEPPWLRAAVQLERIKPPLRYLGVSPVATLADDLVSQRAKQMDFIKQLQLPATTYDPLLRAARKHQEFLDSIAKPKLPTIVMRNPVLEMATQRQAEMKALFQAFDAIRLSSLLPTNHPALDVVRNSNHMANITRLYDYTSDITSIQSAIRAILPPITFEQVWQRAYDELTLPARFLNPLGTSRHRQHDIELDHSEVILAPTELRGFSSLHQLIGLGLSSLGNQIDAMDACFTDRGNGTAGPIQRMLLAIKHRYKECCNRHEAMDHIPIVLLKEPSPFVAVKLAELWAIKEDIFKLAQLLDQVQKDLA